MRIKKKLKQYNPFSNSTIINDTKFKWKISPKGKKTKIKFEVSKDISDVEFYAMIEGQPYLISQEGIGVNLNEDASNIFKAKIGFTKKF